MFNIWRDKYSALRMKNISKACKPVDVTEADLL